MQASGPVPLHGGAAAQAAHPAQAHSATARKRHRRRKKKKAAPQFPSDAAAQPATISLKDGTLTVDANNSDLAEILRNVAELSGMTIDGLNKSTRVFGVYGPGSPSVVLTKLLAGSGYNFAMAGHTTDGAPRELLLTAQNGSAPAATNAPAPAAVPAAPPVSTPSSPNDDMQQQLEQLKIQQLKQEGPQVPQ